MKHLNIILTFFCIFVNTSQAGSVENNAKISSGNVEFAKSLYKEVAKSVGSGNVIFSPLSIHVVLALTYMGAGGETARQLATGLRLPTDPAQVKAGFQLILQGLMNDNKNVTIEIANKIYVSKEFHVKNAFVETAVKYFQSEVQTVDFSSHHVADTINGWVQQRTHKKITNVIAQHSLSQATTMLLINAVYFKGLWSQSFLKEKTKKLPFSMNSTHENEVPMMNIVGDFKYSKQNEIEAEVLVLPYQGNSQHFVIILPFDVDGLSKVEDKFASTEINGIIKNMRKSKVSVSLPKFKLEEAIDLKNMLPKIGISKMFGKDADFSHVSERPLKVSKVSHKAVIDVNEEGTEAAAATHVVVEYESDEQVNIFNANHPFLFLLQCTKSESVLFMGRLTMP